MGKYNEILRELREDRDLRQAEVAQILGTSQQHYSRYETGEIEMPLRALGILADFYNVSTDYLMGRTECREGIAGLNVGVAGGYTVGKLVSEILSLSTASQASVIEYIGLQKIKDHIHEREAGN